jgi:hypothetical protein
MAIRYFHWTVFLKDGSYEQSYRQNLWNCVISGGGLNFSAVG